MIKIVATNPEEWDELLSDVEYKEHLGA